MIDNDGEKVRGLITTAKAVLDWLRSSVDE
jgi:hypothetical protein